MLITSTPKPQDHKEMDRHFMIRQLTADLFDAECPPPPFPSMILIGAGNEWFGLSQTGDADELTVRELVTIETCRVDFIATKGHFDGKAFKEYQIKVERIFRIAMRSR